MSALPAVLQPDAHAYARARRPLEKASTLPPRAYTSPEIYQLEVERIFLREWLCAGRAEQISNPGDYFTLDLLGEKLVVARDRAGEIRALSRVCRHRFAEVVRGSGTTQSFQCPYHAWTYGLDGRLIGAPLMDRAEGFDRATCRLPALRTELWEGWIFVNFDPDAEALAPALAPLTAELRGYRLDEMVATDTAVYPSAFNWKMLVDNFMEAYHHIAIHRRTFEPFYPARRSYSPESEGPYSLLKMPRQDASSGDEPVPLPPELVVGVVFPCHLFAPGADSLTWYQLLPERHDHFTLRIFTCVPRDQLGDPGGRSGLEKLQSFTRHIHDEDIGACEAVWAGLHTRHVEQGRLCPLEKPIWQFNQWWLDRLSV